MNAASTGFRLLLLSDLSHLDMLVVSHHPTDRRFKRGSPNKGSVGLSAAKIVDVKFMTFKTKGVALKNLGHDQLVQTEAIIRSAAINMAGQILRGRKDKPQ